MLNIFQMSILMIFHPNDALDIIKRERNNFHPLRAVALMLALAIVNYTYTFYVNYIFGTKSIQQANIFLDLAVAFLPLLIWVVAVYAVTAVVVGESSFTELLTASTYCLVPVIVLKPLLGLLSMILTTDEAMVFNGLTSIMFAWMLVLLFYAVKRLNDYTMLKTVCVVLLSILAMLIICGVVILIFTLFWQVVSFVQEIIKEVQLKY